MMDDIGYETTNTSGKWLVAVFGFPDLLDIPNGVLGEENDSKIPNL
jgi:hypothetical protein